MYLCSRVHLFRERLSEKVHATIPKGILGGFEFTVPQKNLKEWHEKAGRCLQELKESNKSSFDNYSVRSSAIDHIQYYLSGLSRAHFFRQPFSKQLCTGRLLSLYTSGEMARLPGITSGKSWLPPFIYTSQYVRLPVHVRKKESVSRLASSFCFKQCQLRILMR